MTVITYDQLECAQVQTEAGWKLSVIIPAYNEEKGIAAIVERVLRARPMLSSAGITTTEVVVVDDGSRDRTAAILREYHDVRLVCHSVNRGYGAALKTGFYNATGNMLAFLDADGTYPPEYLPSLCRAVINGADLVIGSRMSGEQKSEMPVTRRIGNFFFANVVSLIGRHHVSDSASGMRVFRRDILEQLYPLPDGLNFTPVMSTRAIHEGLKMAEVPIPYSERLGRSKLSVVRDGFRFLNSIVWTALSYNPVRILGAIGIAGVSIALLVLVALVVLRMGGVAQLAEWGVFAVYTGLVLGVTGVSLFSLGAMFNYLVSLFQKRPVRQGMFGKPIFNPPLERHFWWMGGLSVLVGTIVGVGSLVMSFNGWDISRLWLWLLGSAMLTLMGVQLIISWLVIRVLAELSQRETKAGLDLLGKV
ncbi:MAG: glycosyltransferase family 2 protein [Chloroflexi bacterium]|nr:glycosyltransferase family 2 protein [Chloroflexota bacterium]